MYWYLMCYLVWFVQVLSCFPKIQMVYLKMIIIYMTSAFYVYGIIFHIIRYNIYYLVSENFYEQTQLHYLHLRSSCLDRNSGRSVLYSVAIYKYPWRWN